MRMHSFDSPGVEVSDKAVLFNQKFSVRFIYRIDSDFAEIIFSCIRGVSAFLCFRRRASNPPPDFNNALRRSQNANRIQ